MVTLVLLIFCVTILLALFPPVQQDRRLFLFVLLGVTLIFIAGFRPEGSDQDYMNYLEMYKHINNDRNIITEPSFVWIAKLSSTALMMFIIYAVLGVTLKLVAITKLTKLWFLSLMIYCSCFFLLHDFTQIRVAVSSGLLLLCVKPIYDRNWQYFLLFSFLAILFHFSAIIILPLWVLGHKPRIWHLALSVPIAYLVYFSGVNLIASIPIPYVQEKINAYQMLQELGDNSWSAINVFNLVFLAKIAIFYLLLWKHKLIIKNNKYYPIVMKIQAISIMSFPIFATMPVLGFRINELYGIIEIITIPLLYYLLKPQLLSRLVVCTIGVVLILISLFSIKLVA